MVGRQGARWASQSGRKQIADFRPWQDTEGQGAQTRPKRVSLMEAGPRPRPLPPASGAAIPPRGLTCHSSRGPPSMAQRIAPGEGNGRDGEIRTLDLLLPKQALYQAKLRPVFYSGPTGKERPRDPKARSVAIKIITGFSGPVRPVGTQSCCTPTAKAAPHNSPPTRCAAVSPAPAYDEFAACSRPGDVKLGGNRCIGFTLSAPTEKHDCQQWSGCALIVLPPGA